MRLVAWNARKGRFARKAPLLDPFEADLAVIPEIAAPEAETDQLLWFGDRQDQGIAVVARGAFRLKRLRPLPGVPKHVIPVEVSGPRSFLLFAVWTLKQPQASYIRAVGEAITRYRRRFAKSPVVMLGDFNSNAIWDDDHPEELGHSAVVARLRDLGLVSAYHHHRGLAHGHEAEPTFYLYDHEHRPFHLDYCFLPATWADTIRSVEVGTYAAWRGQSDHRPLIVDVGPE